MQLPSSLPEHPRLLVRPGAWTALRDRIETDAPSARLYQALRHRADAILGEPPVERHMTGRMLLMIARQALERLSVLALVDRVTEDDRYGRRAIAELESICRFTDWNPDHFLDTAELCLAVSIGFDWLHHALSAEQREEIAEALLAKGIEPSLDPAARHNWWLTTDENWAQVCHGGVSAAAIAIADRDPQLAQRVLSRAVAAIPRVAASYAPDGAYPEGPMYWSYGTAYHVMLAAALDVLSGSAQGIDTYPGFAESAGYINAMTSPSGDYFNYADCAARRRLQAQLFWMSARYGHPEWLEHDLATLDRDLNEYLDDPAAQYWYYDMVALALLWRTPQPAPARAAARHWYGGGRMPVATYRWGERDFFLGVKGGSVGPSHSHMDVGSFVFEASGVRWAVDTGMQDYAGLEAAGVDLWNEREQDSQRWTIFRIGPESHNILRVGNGPQRLFRHAPLAAEEARCAIDLSGLYGSEVTAARRFELLPDGFLLDDRWAAAGPLPARSQWLTIADVEPRDGGIILHQDGQRLVLRIEADPQVSVVVENLERPCRSFDAPNPGLRRLLFSSAGSSSGWIRIIATA